MNINFRRIIESKIGDTLEHRFGYDSEIILKEIFKNKTITESELSNILKNYRSVNPEIVAFIALFCPLLVIYVTSVITNNVVRFIYRCLIIFWYFLVILQIISWNLSKTEFITYGICFILVSWTFRNWAREHNLINLVADLLSDEEKSSSS